MKRWCIAVIDASRARIYTYQDQVHPSRQLRAVRELVSTGPSFANELVVAIERIVRAHGYRHVIVVASQTMLDEVRSADAGLRRANVTLDTIPRDLTRLTSSQAHDRLTSPELVSARQHSMM